MNVTPEDIQRLADETRRRRNQIPKGSREGSSEGRLVQVDLGAEGGVSRTLKGAAPGIRQPLRPFPKPSLT
jgi:hypothetical protein